MGEWSTGECDVCGDVVVSPEVDDESQIEMVTIPKGRLTRLLFTINPYTNSDYGQEEAESYHHLQPGDLEGMRSWWPSDNEFQAYMKELEANGLLREGV